MMFIHFSLRRLPRAGLLFMVFPSFWSVLWTLVFVCVFLSSQYCAVTATVPEWFPPVRRYWSSPAWEPYFRGSIVTKERFP
jgi:hypothetical protein